MLFLIGQVLPYLAAGVFLAGMIWRIATWLKCPVPFKLTMFPAPADTAGRVLAISKELILFDSLRRSEQGLWLWAWLMHIGLFAVVGGHIVGISQLGLQFTALGMSPSQSVAMSAALGTGAGILLLGALIVLFYRRTAVPEVKRMSNPADYFDILLLLAIVISGMHMRLTTLEVDLAAIRSYMAGLITFCPAAAPQNWIFLSHFFLVNILLIYFPFSKLVHLAGFFVTRSLIVAPPPAYPTAGSITKADFGARRAAE
ncbi:MAG: respiratory nitrate reductase subunit gamma [Veillonellaceae bacterium]|nr:respiratory nitrate reductase subunit gamma [Veillonellaceae bacterium]